MSELNNVFGVSRDQVLSYIERDKIDTEFSDSLSTGKHIVVYGASKQGKTSFRYAQSFAIDTQQTKCVRALNIQRKINGNYIR